jgi:transcriptional regulator with XRE-family HTH domain
MKESERESKMTIQEIKIECIKNKTSLTKLCQKAGVSRSLISRWEQQPPKYLEVVGKLEKALEEVKIGRG